MLALVPELVADINPAGTFGEISQIVALGDVALFVADDGVHGAELWRSDGTDEGTRLLADLNPSGGSLPQFMAPLGDHWLFTADDGEHGRELWRTDGTAAGTELLWESIPGPDSLLDDAFAGQSAASETQMFFTAGDGSIETQLWRTDGNTEGTSLVTRMPHHSEAVPNTSKGLSELTLVGERLYFTYDDAIHGRELWSSDGTAETTRLVKDVYVPDNYETFPPPERLTPAGEFVYFIAFDQEFGRELWRTDGTEAGTLRLTDFEEDSFDRSFTILRAGSEGVYFNVLDRDSLGWTGVWRAQNDRAAAGLVRPFLPFEFGSNGLPADDWGFDGLFEDRLLFVSYFGPIDPYAYEIVLWREISLASLEFRAVARLGTRHGSVLNGSQPGPVGPAVSQFTDSTQGRVYFVVDNREAGQEVWMRDENTNETRLVKDIAPGPAGSRPSLLTPVGDKMFFKASADRRRGTLWVSDGTEAGTRAINLGRRAGVGSQPKQLTVAGDKLFFVADDGEHGMELWTSDGSSNGTILVADLFTGERGAFDRTIQSGLTPFGDGSVYFTLYVGYLSELNGLWSSDGTVDGTGSLVNQFTPHQGVFGMRSIGNVLYLPVFDGSVPLCQNRNSLWALHHGQSAAERLGFVGLSDWSSIGNAKRLLDQAPSGAVFVNTPECPGQQGVQISVTDGTLEGTRELLSLNYPLHVSEFIVSGNVAYFVGGPYIQSNLYGVDLTTRGVTLLKEFDDRPSVRDDFGLIDFQGTLLFTNEAVRDGVLGYELWKSDGTVNSTSLVRWFPTDSVNFYPAQFTEANGQLYFVMYDQEHGEELWRTDGTPEGTALVTDIVPGPRGAKILNLTAVNGTLFFSADDQVHGSELWRSDGTAAGTFLVADLATREFPYNSSYPHDFVAFQGALYFGARDDLHGDELFKITPPAGDTNFDGQVNLTDLNHVRNNFGGSGLGDTNGDGVVDTVDLNAVRNNLRAEAPPVVRTTPRRPPTEAFAAAYDAVFAMSMTPTETPLKRLAKRPR